MILLVMIFSNLDHFASSLAQRHKRKRLLGGNPRCFYLLFLVVLMFVTTVEISLYLYFQALCQVQPLIARKFKSCDMLSRNRLCLLDRKIHYKSPHHIFDLNCFDNMLYTIEKLPHVLSFLILVAEVPLKNIYYLLFWFSQLLPCFVFSQFCKS